MASAESTIADLKSLEQKLEELLGLCGRLHDENRSLRTSQESLVHEKAELVSKNEQARTRVEAMISRLKSLEQS